MLKGVKVLELTTGPSGAYAGRLFVQSGAEVTKLIYKFSSISTYHDQEKHFIVIGKLESYIDKLEGLLIRDWDIVIWDNHIIEYDSYLMTHTEQLDNTIKVRLDLPEGTGLGEEQTLQAIGGWMELTGSPHKSPLSIGGRPATSIVGAHVATAGMLALVERKWNKQKELLTVCALTVIVSGLEGAYSDYLETGIARFRPGNRHHSIAPMSILQAEDGWLLLGATVDEQWEILRNWAELPNVQRWQSTEGRKENSIILENCLSRWTKQQSKENLFLNGQTFRMPFAKVQSIGELKNCPQLKHRNLLSFSHKGETRVQLPWKTSSVSASPQSLFRAESWQEIRILDLTNMWSGPYCTRLFADLGAEVIKVEAHHRPDGIRGGRDDSKPFFRELNRNKKGIQLDLRLVDDRDKLLHLVQSSDILIENFSPRVMRNFNLDPETLWRYQPTLGIIALSAFGQTGPYQHFVGYGPTLEAMSGIASLTHYPDGAPWLPGFSISDIGAGIHGAFALATVLHQKGQHDKGFRVDLSQYETACQFIGDHLMEGAVNSDLDQIIRINSMVDIHEYQVSQLTIPNGSPVLGPPWYKQDWDVPHRSPPTLL